MTATRTPPASHEVTLRHAGLVRATEHAVDALPALSPDASPQSFPALKGALRPEAGE